MSKSENVALYKYLTRPSSSQLQEASGERLKKVAPTINLNNPVQTRTNFQYGGPAYLESVFKEAMESNNYDIDDIAKSAAAKKAELYDKTKLGTYKLPTSKQKLQDMFKRYVAYERSMSPEEYTKYIKERIANPNLPQVEGWNKPLKGTPLEPKGLGATKNTPVSNLTKAEKMLSPNELKQWRSYTKKQMRKAKYERTFQKSERFNPETGQFEYDPKIKQEALGKKYLRKSIRRAIKADAYKQLSPTEKTKYLDFEKRLDTIGNIIKEKPEYLLENREVMNKLSTAVDPQTGEIYQKSPSFTDIKNRRIWEVEHIDPVVEGQTKGRGAFLRNLQVLPEPIHKNFKNNAESFLNKHYGDKKYQSQVDNIINKANELKVELRVKDVGKVGYKPTFTNFADKADDVISTYVKNPKARTAYTQATGNVLKSEAIPGSKTAGEFISSTVGDFARGSIGKGLLKTLGIAGVGYGIYDTGVAFKEGRSGPEMTARFVGLDPVYNMIKEYNRLPKEAQAIQKKINAQMSFDATKDDPLAEGMMQRPEVSDEEKLILDKAKQKVREDIQAENQARAEGRMGFLNFIKQKTFEATGQPYEMAFANGGRVYFADGGDPKDLGRRRFIKFGVALASIPFLGRYIKPVTKAGPEIVEAVSRTADSVPTYLMDLISKVKMMGSSKIIGKADNPNGFVQYDLGDYTVTDGAEFTRIKKRNERGEFIDSEVEMEIQRDPETGTIQYEEATAFPDEDGKLKDVDFGIEDDLHETMKKFTYEK